MIEAKPYTTCANGCGVPAKWKVKRGRFYKNLCNTCVTRSHDRAVKHTTRTAAEKQRKAEVLGRLGYDRK